MERILVAGRTYVITPYAERRLEARSISRAELEAVLGNPLAVVAAGDPVPRVIHRRTAAGRRLSVVVERGPTDMDWEVVTAWEVGQNG